MGTARAKIAFLEAQDATPWTRVQWWGARASSAWNRTRALRYAPGMFAIRFAGLATMFFACGGRVAADAIGGTYSVTARNGEDTCTLGWTPHASSATAVKINEGPDGEDAFTVKGADGVLVSFLVPSLGSAALVFPSTVSGDVLTGTAHGSIKQTVQGCVFTIDAMVKLTVDGANLVGTITYSPVTNGDAACSTLSSCSQQQSLSGVRQ